jgi:hypothetical protein
MLLALERAQQALGDAAVQASAGEIEALPDVVVGLSTARAQQKAALVAIQTAREMDDSILDIVA